MDVRSMIGWMEGVDRADVVVIDVMLQLRLGGVMIMNGVKCQKRAFVC